MSSSANPSGWREYRICGEREPGQDAWHGTWKTLRDGEVDRSVRNEALALGKRNAQVWIETRTLTVSDLGYQLVVG